MRLEELTQPGWGGPADYFRERDMKSGMTEFRVLAVGKPQTDTTAATASLTTCGELKQALDIVPTQSQVTSRQGSSHMRLSEEQPHADDQIVPMMPNTVPNSSQIDIANPVQPVSFYHWIHRH